MIKTDTLANAEPMPGDSPTDCRMVLTEAEVERLAELATERQARAQGHDCDEVTAQP